MPRGDQTVRLFSPLVAALLVGAALGACGGTPDDNGAPSVVGTWRGSTTMGCLGQVSDEVIFKADGTFSRLTTSSQVNCVPGTLMVRTTGDYEVDEGNGVIRLSNIDTEPKEQCLPPTGCQPVHAVTSDTLTYTMPDDNTLTLSCGPGCVITYSRASP
jgi:hypothetical protein